jgi:lysophospholipase L1-like esterase
MGALRRPGIPVAAVWAAFPVLLTQGLKVRRTVLRLPDADGLTGEVSGPGEPLHLVVVGDSVAAGVGVDHHRETLTGELARLLAVTGGRAVRWEVIAKTGATAGEIAALVHDRPEVAAADVLLLSVGVNDTKNLHSDRRWRAELGDLLDGLRRTAPNAHLIVLGLPPMEVFPSLPWPLSSILGARSRRVDSIARDMVAARPGVLRIELELPTDPTLFARDGFHPSAVVHARLAEAALALLPR